MEKIEHKEFQQINALKDSSFSQPVQRKIRIFDRMHSKLGETVDEDHEELSKQLKAFDREIAQDMEDEFEDRLQHNESQTTNEDILENLYSKGKTILLSELRKAGFKGDWRNPAGDYWLEKVAVFTYEFRVTRKKPLRN
jgi:hypothetical protein